MHPAANVFYLVALIPFQPDFVFVATARATSGE